MENSPRFVMKHPCQHTPHVLVKRYGYNSLSTDSEMACLECGWSDYTPVDDATLPPGTRSLTYHEFRIEYVTRMAVRIGKSVLEFGIRDDDSRS